MAAWSDAIWEKKKAGREGWNEAPLVYYHDMCVCGPRVDDLGTRVCGNASGYVHEQREPTVTSLVIDLRHVD